MLYPRTDPIPRSLCSIESTEVASDGANGANGANGAAGGGSASGGDAGAGSEKTELTLESIAELIAKRDAKRDEVYEKRFKKLNDELASRRHGTQPGKDAEDKKPNGESKTSDSLTREDLRGERGFIRTIETLRADGMDPDALEEIESAGDAMPPAQRSEYAKAIKRAYDLGRKSAEDPQATGGREAGAGSKKDIKTRGGGQPPASRPSMSLPSSWAEYVALAKSDPKRKAELDRLPLEQFDPAELRRSTDRGVRYVQK